MQLSKLLIKIYSDSVSSYKLYWNHLHIEICDCKTKSKDYMKKHTETIHEGKKPYHCLNCDAKFAMRSNFKAQVALVHKVKEMWNLCKTICNKSDTELSHCISSVHGSQNQNQTFLSCLFPILCFKEICGNDASSYLLILTFKCESVQAKKKAQ